MVSRGMWVLSGSSRKGSGEIRVGFSGGDSSLDDTSNGEEANVCGLEWRFFCMSEEGLRTHFHDLETAPIKGARFSARYMRGNVYGAIACRSEK